MSDFTDDIINGFLCSGCGLVIDGDEPGYPRECSACSKPDDENDKWEFNDTDSF